MDASLHFDQLLLQLLSENNDARKAAEVTIWQYEWPVVRGRGRLDPARNAHAVAIFIIALFLELACPQNYKCVCLSVCPLTKFRFLLILIY